MSGPEDVARAIASQASEADPTGWFERLYVSARSGEAIVPWDREGPFPLLTDWTAEQSLDGDGRSAVVVGCGLGDDAEHLSGLGFATTAFDVSPTAIASAGQRYPDSRVGFTTADLLALPAGWSGAFDFVFENRTVQSLPISLHQQAIASVRSLVAPGGTVLVIASAREEGGHVSGPPWPLTPSEIEAFGSHGLNLVRVERLAQDGDTTDLRWRAEAHREA